MLKTLIFYVFSLLFCLVGAAGAQQDSQIQQSTLPDRPLPPGVTLSAIVDANKIVLGDRIQYQIVIDGNLVPEQLDSPSFQDTGAFELLDGPNRSVTMQFVNGKQSQRISFSYTLRAIDIGTFELKPARLKLNGVWYETNSVSIQIEDLPEVEGDFGTIISAKTDDNAINRQLQNRYFARIEYPEKVYHGQAVPIDVYVYRDPVLPEFIQWRLMKNLSGQDFIVPDVVTQQTVNNQIRWENVQFGGKNFQRAHLFTAFVVPAKTGSLRLTPPLLRIALPVDARYRRRNMDDFFDQMFSPNVGQIIAELQIRMAELDVEATPPKPAEAVAQIVGDARIEAKVDRDALPQRELLTVTVDVRGKGYFDLLSRPKLPDFPGLSLVDTHEEAEVNVARSMLLSTKKFEFIYQALQPGEIKIPSLDFSVFNPETGQQNVVSTDEISVKITPDESNTLMVGGADPNGAPTAQPAQTQRKADARVLGSDVSYIDTAPLTAASVKRSREFYLQPWFWLIQLIPAALSLGYGIVVLRTRSNRGESETARHRKARRAAETALKDARASLEGAKREEFYSKLAGGMMSLVAVMLGRSQKGLTIEEAVDALRRRGYDQEACQSLHRMLQHCDAIRYSPAEDNADVRRQALEDAQAVLVQLSTEGENG